VKPLFFFLPLSLLHSVAMQKSELEFTPTASLYSDSRNSTATFSKTFFRLGDQLITLEKIGNDAEHSYLFVSLHDNEADAIKTTMQIAQKNQVDFVRLVNEDKKNVEAIFLDRKISFDPNSIFTQSGRRSCLLSNKYLDKITNMKIQQFAQFILNEVEGEQTIVVVHAENGRGIVQYKKGGRMSKSAKRVFKSSLTNNSNFFLTASEDIFIKLRDKNCNVVLLHKKNIRDDGSLAVYCVKTGRSYVSIETSATDTAAQAGMLDIVTEVLR
jgi:hypothetical protein